MNGMTVVLLYFCVWGSVDVGLSDYGSAPTVSSPSGCGAALTSAGMGYGVAKSA